MTICIIAIFLLKLEGLSLAKKENFMKTRHNHKAFLMLLLLGLAPSSVLAQSDPLLDDAESVLVSEQIDIHGVHTAPKQPTQADRIEAMRKKLEERNEQMVQKRIEDMRMKEEQKLANKLSAAFGNQQFDQVSVKQAAPKKKVIAPLPVLKKKTKKNKVIPSVGMLNIAGDNGLELEANANVGLSLESMVHERISVGVGINYATMDITDTANQYSGSYNQSYNNYNSYNYSPYYNSGYQQYYGQGREMSYSRLGVELNSKFFFTVDSQIKPYAGLGLGWNRHELAYDNNTQYNLGNVRLGDENFSSSYLSGSASAGAEISFGDTVGAGLEFKYMRSVGSSFNSKSSQSNKNPDQLRLENIGGEIEEASNMSLNAALIIKF